MADDYEDDDLPADIADQIESALRSLPRAIHDPRVAAPLFDVRQTAFTINLNTTAIVAQDNASRIGLIIATITGSATLLAGVAANTGTGNGIPLQSTGINIDRNFRQHGGLTQVAWYVRNNGAAAVVVVIETFYRPVR